MHSEPRSFLPRRVVIGAGAHAEMAAGIRARRPSLELRGNDHTRLTDDDLVWADTYVGFRRPPLATTMGAVRWVHCTGAGVDSWLYPRELPPDILLTRTSESFGPMIAEWAIARALAFTQKIELLAEQQRRREWRPVDVTFVRGTHAVVVGTGDVGAHIGALFRALGARVTGVSRAGRGDRAIFDSVVRVDHLRDAVRDADWLVLALPLTKETDGLVTADVLTACHGAVLINAGRGAVVDERAIPQALGVGALRGAALDVFETEPLPTDSPLWSDPRVMVSPHLSGPTTIAGAVDGFIECVESLEQNRWPERTVDRARQY
jgi:phosphoglycerate dehydrogenase-like enzyme